MDSWTCSGAQSNDYFFTTVHVSAVSFRWSSCIKIFSPPPSNTQASSSLIVQLDKYTPHAACMKSRRKTVLAYNIPVIAEPSTEFNRQFNFARY